MKPLVMFLPFALFSCADRPLIYTGTQFSIHASGVKNEVPEKLAVGYDRSEYVWLPRGGASSIQGAYDAEYRFPQSLAVSELLITGKAAAGEKTAPNEKDENRDSDLIVSTNTKANLGVEGLPTDGNAGFSFNFGYKRSVLALFPKQANDSANGELPSTYTDLTLHANSGISPLNNPRAIAEERQIKAGNQGARIVQTIATGAAAENLAIKDKGKLRERIAAGLDKKAASP